MAHLTTRKFDLHVSFCEPNILSDRTHVQMVSSQRTNVYEPGDEKMCLMSYVNNKVADQHLCFRCLDSIISLDSIAEISRL